MGKSALVFSFSGKWGKSPLSCNFWRFEFDAGWGNAISSTHKLRGCGGHNVSGRYSITSPQPRARGHFFSFFEAKMPKLRGFVQFQPKARYSNHKSSIWHTRGNEIHHCQAWHCIGQKNTAYLGPFFSFFEAKMAKLRWFSEFLCNFNPRRGIQFICQAIGMRGAMWYMIELGHYIGLGYISCPLGTRFHCLGPKWVHFGGLRYVCAISTLGGFNHIYEQYIRMGGGAALQTLEVWLSTTKRSGDRGPKLRVCNPNHLGHGPI